jgi:hypothetical protein
MNWIRHAMVLGMALAVGAGCVPDSNNSRGGGSAGSTIPAARNSDRASADMFTALDTSKNTKLAVTEYWKSVMGKEYGSSGVVVDVRGRRNMAEVRIFDRGRQSMAGGYNLVLLVPNIDSAVKLRKGDQIRFKGYLASYRSGRQGGVVVTLKDAEVLR